MGQLFDRVSRIVRAEVNSDNYTDKSPQWNEGITLVTGGAVAGAAIGNVGILAGGAGYSLGAVPLASLGALTGTALYEALRSLIEDDTSSTSAAVIGATAGAATSATIGGVGVAVGGSAIGVGMASMAVGGAIVGVGLVGLSRLLQQGIDPEKLLDQAIDQMEMNLQNARQALINLIASQKRINQQYEKTQVEIDKWERRAQLALQKDDDFLAREALTRKKINSERLNSLKIQTSQESSSVTNFKKNIMFLEVKIVEAKTMRASLKTQIAAAKVNAQLSQTSIAMAAFEDMEEKVMRLEARPQATAELMGADLEQQFAALESSDRDLELEAMKQQMLAGLSQSHQSLSENATSQSQATQKPKDAVIDIELEDLKRQLERL
ncbi:MAG: PspA/IM30 family protein [Leptolyngbya sp. Prado105]|nr:PspA/IM30 family protein [Leptolyngbya sp. Prado105]